MVGQFAVKHYKNDTRNSNFSKTCLDTMSRVVVKGPSQTFPQVFKQNGGATAQQIEKL